MKRLATLLIIVVFLVSLSPFLSAQGDWKTKIAEDVLERIQYVGMAVPGTATSDSLWQIMRVTYIGATTRIDSTDYANGDATHKWIWDDRATYTYS